MIAKMQTNEILDMDVLQSLPPEREGDFLAIIRDQIARIGSKVVILDDDPTGTQTIHGLPVITHWSEDVLIDELQSEYPAFFILTNSRSLPEERAVLLGAEIGAALNNAVRKCGAKAVVVSRSDSTLRGHFPSEVDAVAKAMGKGKLPYVIIPFFLEGGRYTLNDIHYVREGDKLLPAADTPFAKDAVFGFHHSNLKQWVEEKSDGRIKAEAVMSITLNDIRSADIRVLTEKFLNVTSDTACIVNAVSYKDMEVVVTALMEAEAKGAEFLYRTAASFVRSRMGIAAGVGLLAPEQLVSESNHGGLFLIGSYVPKTGKQVEALLSKTEVAPVEVMVSKLLDDNDREQEIKRVVGRTTELLTAGRDVAVYTSRQLVTGKDAGESLAIGSIISDSLIRIVRCIEIQPRYLVAKGGITSSDVATKGLGVRRAMVLGQALPGVPAWKIGSESRYPGMSYIVFPGNVGDDDALVRIQQNLGCVVMDSHKDRPGKITC